MLARAMTRRTSRRRKKPVVALLLGEGIPDPTQRHDVARRGGIRLDLFADVTDVDVDGSLVLLKRVVVAHELEQLSPGVRPARAAREVPEQVEFGGGEADAIAVARHAAAIEV